MKKVTISLLTILFLVFNNLSINAQVTKQEAISILMDSIVGNKSDSVNVFISSQIVSGEYFNISLFDSINAPCNNYWLGFIDEQPLYMWNHLCTYVFIDETNGNYYLDSQTSPPFGYSTQFDTINIAIDLSIPPLDYSIPNDSINISINKHLYAVLYTGYGQNGDPLFWNHLSHMYCALKEKGFAEENIYALSGNGQVDNTFWGNNSLDLDNDSDDDILNIPCSIHNLDSIFQLLKLKMTNDDLLFVFVTTHGDKGSKENKSYFELYQKQKLWDSTFAAMLNDINCSQMIIPLYACNSGGFIDDLSISNNYEKRTVFSATDWYNAYPRDSRFISTYNMDIFPYFLITAFRGYHPNPNAPWNKSFKIGEHPGDTINPILFNGDFNPDLSINAGNEDSIIQIGETIFYTKSFDNPFYLHGVINYDCGFIKEDLLSLTGISGVVDTTQTLQGNYLIGGELYVNPGVKLTLDTSTSFFVSGTKIIVKQGAVLSVDGATITGTHDSLWQGIEVWGNTNSHQYTINDSCAQGKLFLKNNAILKNAYNAVTLWRPESWDNRGGIIIAKDSKFINNKRSVEFMAYQNHHPVNGKETDYVSSFTNCDFIYDDNYLLSDSTKNHVTMWGVRGVEFRGCSFNNDVISEPNTGYGIFSLDAGYRITDYCNAQVMPCPVSGIIRSTFKGLKCGIQSANVDKPLYHISVFNSDFTNNGYGIHLTSVYSPVIVNNNFELGTIYDTCNNLFGTGIYFDNSKAFAVENNNFTPFDGSIDADYIGIRVNNTNNAGDEIYRNSYNGLDVAIQAEGKNWLTNNETGLAYYCNDNQNNKADFYVKRHDYYDGIQKFQGSDSQVAGNTFSPGADDSSNFYNESYYKIIYHYDQNGQNEEPVKHENVEVAAELLTKVCPDHYDGGDIRLSSTDYQQRENDYNTATASYNNASSNYDNANDSSTRAYWAGKMSYYNTERVRAAYDIIRSDMADTIAHEDKFVEWMGKLDTYTANEALVDYYMQQGDYTTALNKVDSLPYRFTFTAYDSTEYPMYHDFKHEQAGWLADGRNIFDLTASEISSLITIADSSRGTAGAQARAILRFAYPSQYSYIDCYEGPGGSTKSAQIKGSSGENRDEFSVQVKPNPANNTVTFSYTLPENTTSGIIELIDNTGKTIKRIKLTNAATRTIDCATMPSGIYYYRVTAGSSSKTGKLVIQH